MLNLCSLWILSKGRQKTVNMTLIMVNYSDSSFGNFCTLTFNAFKPNTKTFPLVGSCRPLSELLQLNQLYFEGNIIVF